MGGVHAKFPCSRHSPTMATYLARARLALSAMNEGAMGARWCGSDTR